jgi:stage V sporulation protein AD
MASFKFNNVYIKDNYSVVGPKEAEGNIKNFDLVIPDYYFDEKTFENAEIKMQETVMNYLLSKEDKIDAIVGGELSNQIALTSYMMANYCFPFLGCYSACATFNEAMILLSVLIDSKKIKRGIAITSSHNLVAERQFRYPVEYGAPKPKKATYTATGAVGCLLTKDKTNIKVEAATIGSVIDYGIKDAFNMGAVMAPAAVDTLIKHLYALKREPSYYDIILTGDLGEVGNKLFKELLKIKYHYKLNNYVDAGSIMYTKEQHLCSGSSGPVTLPLVLFNKILKDKKYHKILIIATGSLQSPTLINQHDSIPGIAHAISLEVYNDLS